VGLRPTHFCFLQNASELMMASPSVVEDKQLQELFIKLDLPQE